MDSDECLDDLNCCEEYFCNGESEFFIDLFSNDFSLLHTRPFFMQQKSLQTYHQRGISHFRSCNYRTNLMNLNEGSS